MEQRLIFRLKTWFRALLICGLCDMIDVILHKEVV